MVQLENLGIRTVKLIKSMIRDKWDNTLAATKDWIDNHPSIVNLTCVNNVCIKSYPNDQGLHPSLALAAVVESFIRNNGLMVVENFSGMFDNFFFSLFFISKNDFLFSKMIFYFWD